LSKRKRRRREKQRAHPNDQKPKPGHLKMSKTWSPKTWATTRRNQVKHKVSPQEEATGSTPLAKLEKPKNC
jgi:hypothetical protein